MRPAESEIEEWEEQYVSKLLKKLKSGMQSQKLIYLVFSHLFVKGTATTTQLARKFCIEPLDDFQYDIKTIHQYRRVSTNKQPMYVYRYRYRGRKEEILKRTKEHKYRQPILFGIPSKGIWSINPRITAVIEKLKKMKAFSAACKAIEQLPNKDSCEPVDFKYDEING